MINLTTKNKFTTEDSVDKLINNGNFKLTRDDWYHVALAAYQVNTLQDYVTAQIPLIPLNGFYLVTSKLNTTVGIGFYETLPISKIALFGSPITALKKGTILKDSAGTTAIIDSVDLEEGTVIYRPYSVRNYLSIINKPSINSTELLGNKTSADLGIYDMGVYPSFDTIKDTKTTVSNTIALSNIDLLGKPITALKHGDFIVDKFGSTAIIDTINLENFTATYVTWNYHNYNKLANKPTLNGKVIQGNLTTADFGIKDGEQGPQGEVGPQGPQGERGPQGESGTTDYTALENKPSINGVVLEGDLESEDLDIAKGMIWIGDVVPYEAEDNTLKFSKTALKSNNYPVGSYVLNNKGKVYHITDKSSALIGNKPGKLYTVTYEYTIDISVLPESLPSIPPDKVPIMNYFDVGYGEVEEGSLKVGESGISVNYTNNEIEYEDENGDCSYQHPSFGMKVPIVAGTNVTFEVDKENKVVRINASGGESSSGNSSGIYRVYEHLATEGFSSITPSNIELGDNTLKLGDILIDQNGTTAQVKGINQQVGEQINVGDTFDTLYFDTSITPDFEAFDWSEAEVYNDGEGNLLNGMEFIKLFSCTQWGAEYSFDAFRGTYDGMPFYVLVHGKDGIYYVNVDGWQHSEYTFGEPMTITEVYQQDIWGAYIFKTPHGNTIEYEVVSSQSNNSSTSDENAFTSLASGQPIEKIVFNPNVSVEKMTNYLSGLTYDETIQGIESVCKLVDIDRVSDTICVYAINFGALSGVVPNTSGYGIAVIDTTGSGFVLKQAIFASEYSEANVALVNAIKDANYTLNYTQAGWSDTNDYVLDTNTTHTIFSVHDNKVSAFIGRDTRLWDVLSMFSLASAEGVSF